MSEAKLDMAALQTQLATTAVRAAERVGKGLSESQTISVLIQPVLRALGWDPEDDEHVVPQWGPTSAAKMDWALLHDGKPICIVEAKALDVTLKDKEVLQAVNYAQSHDIEWAVLTNGRVWQLHWAALHGLYTEKKQ